MFLNHPFQVNGKTTFSILFLLSLGISIRLWLIYHHFPHYDDLWGYYRAIHLKSLAHDDFFSKLPPFLNHYSALFEALPFLDWFLRHLVSVREATYHTTLAPLHYFFSLLPVGFSESYEGSLAEARLITLLEYVAFFFLFFCFIHDRHSFERPFLIAFLLLSLFGSLPLYYSAQGHNYMAGLAASVGYLLILQRPCLLTGKAIATRALLYIICILSSYNFILLLPSYYASELYLYYISRSSVTHGNSFGYKRVAFFPYLHILLILLAPLIISLIIKAKYIMPNAVGRGWNSGLSNEYIVSYDSFNSFLGHFYYSASSTLSSLYLPTTTCGFANALIFFLLIPTVLLGLISTCFLVYPSTAADIFSSASLLTFFLFYLSGQVAISPTRHSLIFYALISIVSAKGFSTLRLYLSRHQLWSRMRSLFKPFSVYLYARSVLFLALISMVYFNVIGSQLNVRKDALSAADIHEISKSHTLFYDEYYNFSLAIAPELRHMKEASISWPGRILPVLKKSLKSEPTSGDAIFYATNSFEEKEIADLYNNIKLSSGCVSLEPLQPFRTHVNGTIVDAPPAHLTSIGTNSLRIYKTVCR